MLPQFSVGTGSPRPTIFPWTIFLLQQPTEICTYRANQPCQLHRRCERCRIGGAHDVAQVARLVVYPLSFAVSSPLYCQYRSCLHSMCPRPWILSAPSSSLRRFNLS